MATLTATHRSTSEGRTAATGFHMEFLNGITISVQWGNGNYCENKCQVLLTEEEFWESPDFEYMISDNGKMSGVESKYMLADYEKGTLVHSSDVVGWVKADRLPEILMACRIYPKTIAQWGAEMTEDRREDLRIRIEDLEIEIEDTQALVQDLLEVREELQLELDEL